MVIELGMVSVLTGMGVYFVKSTDLPKDLKSRSEQMKLQSTNQSTQYKPKFNFEKIQNKTIITEKVVIDTEIEMQKNLELRLEQEKEMNALTLKITTLEQEIRDNNQRNAEILLEIDNYLNQLEKLNNQRIS